MTYILKFGPKNSNILQVTPKYIFLNYILGIIIIILIIMALAIKCVY